MKTKKKNGKKGYILSFFLGIIVFLGISSVLAEWPEAPNGVSPAGWLGEVFNLEESNSEELVVKGNLIANDPIKSKHLATKEYVDANNVSNQSIVNASAGFDNHGGNFIALSTKTHNGNFGAKKYADLWCAEQVSGSDHMCNSWELNGLDFTSMDYSTSQEEFLYQHTVIGAMAYLDANNSNYLMTCQYLTGDKIDCTRSNCYNWTSSDYENAGIYCSSAKAVACCSDISASPKIEPTGSITTIRQQSNFPAIEYIHFTPQIGTLIYNLYMDEELISSFYPLNLDYDTDRNLLKTGYIKIEGIEYGRSYTFKIKTVNASKIESATALEKNTTFTCSTGRSSDSDCDGFYDY